MTKYQSPKNEQTHLKMLQNCFQYKYSQKNAVESQKKLVRKQMYT